MTDGRVVLCGVSFWNDFAGVVCILPSFIAGITFNENWHDEDELYWFWSMFGLEAPLVEELVRLQLFSYHGILYCWEGHQHDPKLGERIYAVMFAATFISICRLTAKLQRIVFLVHASSEALR